MKEYNSILIIDTDVIEKVVDWASARNLLEGATADSQFIKMTSEIGELFKGIRLNDQNEVIDGLGDALIVGTIISQQYMGANGFRDVMVNLNRRRKLADTWGCGPNLWESVGELADCIAKKEDGQTFLTKMANFVHGLSFIATIRGIDLNAAYFAAYNDIKDRKGVMYNGVFIKEADPRYAEVVAELAKTV